MITINLNSHNDINEDIFVQNAEKMIKTVINSGILEQSELKEYAFVKNNTEIDVMFCDNETIQEINRDYRHKDSTTDVITFALFADSEPALRLIYEGEIHLGEIIISIEKIKTQAVENQKTFNEELYFILSHGILHLFGFTHENDEKLEKMLSLQQRLMENVKI